MKINANERIYQDISREMLEQIIFSFPDPFVVTDPSGNVLLCNKVQADSLKTQISSLVGMNWEEYSSHFLPIAGEHLPDIHEIIAKKRDSSFLVDTPSSVPSIATARPVLDENGKLLFLIFNARSDIVVSQFNQALADIQRKYEKNENIIKYLRSAKASFPIVAESPAMKKIINTCAQIGETASTVLITGESGTGKEVVAHYIHSCSSRADKLFLPVNCSAIPSELVEAELFGYVKGAFTGAKANGSTGLFEMASEGTLFMDEIGELTLSAQSTLLRVLESGEIRPIGSSSVRKVDVRIIAATNRDLKQMVAEGSFREDLYYRINVIPIHIPVLAQRREDILPLAEQFLASFNKKYQKNKLFSENLRQKLYHASWPGNVRELRNYIERLVVTTYSDLLTASDIREFLPQKSLPSFADDVPEPIEGPDIDDTNYHKIMEHYERAVIRKALKICGNNVAEAAAHLNIHKSLLYKKIKKLGILLDEERAKEGVDSEEA